MKPTVNTYYKDQLDKIKIDSIYAPTIKICSGNDIYNQTKWMDVNKESAAELVKWLTDNFINK